MIWSTRWECSKERNWRQNKDLWQLLAYYHKYNQIIIYFQKVITMEVIQELSLIPTIHSEKHLVRLLLNLKPWEYFLLKKFRTEQIHIITNHYSAQEVQRKVTLLRLKIEYMLWPGYEIEVTNDRDPHNDDIITSFYIKRVNWWNDIEQATD